MNLSLWRIVIATGLLLSIPGGAFAGSALQAKQDVSLQILPRENAPEIFNLDKQELIVPTLKRPKGIDTANAYEAVEAIKHDGKPLILWFKKDLSRYRPLRAEDIYIEVLPKWKTNEATVFSQPGKSHLDCPTTAKEKPCIAWPTRGTSLKFLTATLAESIDPSDHLMKWRLFYQVQYKYTNRLNKVVQGTGWILSEDVIAEERRAPSTPNPTPDGAPTPDMPAPPAQPRTEIDDVVDAISPHLGDCIAPKGKVIRLSTIRTLTSPAFTETLLPHWKNQKLAGPPSVPEISYKGKAITPAQWIAIDTMARTIYGEMASCNLSTGPGYLLAVAKVILNRVYESNHCLGKRGLYMCVKMTLGSCKKLDQPDYINDLTEVMIKPSQFSVWNNERKTDLRRVLCPSGRQEEEKAKQGKSAVKYDIDNWQDSVKIATEAVLDEEGFRKKTSEVTATYYVSGNRRIAGHVRLTQIPTVQGQKLDRGRCIKFMGPVKVSARQCKPIPEATPGTETPK